MAQVDDSVLLNRFVRERSNDALGLLIDRYAPLVYGVCRRRTGQNELAEDATQAVCLILYRRAGSLTRHSSLAGWLYTCADSVSRDAVRREMRRIKLEEKTLRMSQGNPVSSEPFGADLDDAMSKLAPKDREALVLRFIEGYSLAELGQTFKISEDAARMRVQRALDRLRAEFAKIGITSSSESLTGSLAALVKPVPSSLLIALHRADFTRSVPIRIQPLAKGTLYLMTPKLALATLSAISLIAVAGSATIRFSRPSSSARQTPGSIPSTQQKSSAPHIEADQYLNSMIKEFVGNWSMTCKMSGFDQKSVTDPSREVTVTFDPIKSVLKIRGKDTDGSKLSPNYDWAADLVRGTLLMGTSNDPQVDASLQFVSSHPQKKNTVLVFSRQSPHSNNHLTLTYSKTHFAYEMDSSVWQEGKWLKGKFTWQFDRPAPKA